jgi:hypothetical protein
MKVGGVTFTILPTPDAIAEFTARARTLTRIST